ncbi:MAG: 3-methyladenine DNA glycosylase [Bacteroidetes bacterium]|nr:3-methyladenine DNA glycosylase [Bacteroidota bacterium]MCH8524126.1 3-methyladenine DNA glycosylase [Balneolales bacterium]
MVDWKLAEQAQKKLLEPIITPYLEARSHHRRQPVTDFLFEYYSFRPVKLLNWNPGIGVVVPHDWAPTDHRYRKNRDGWSLHPEDFPNKRISALEWVISYQKAILERPPAFGCHGLHEWAMVYRITDVRHNQVPLRLSKDEITQFVESQQIRCSHFDAFRFFTEPARPLNNLQPSRSKRIDLEQGGCIHANMDLYKWCYKFFPWISSDITTKAFLLAWDTRKLDMMASPYDLSDEGLRPIKIETASGREEYTRLQKEIAERARPIREELVDQLESLVDWISLPFS